MQNGRQATSRVISRKIFAWTAYVDAFHEAKLMWLGLRNKTHTKHKDDLMRMI